MSTFQPDKGLSFPRVLNRFPVHAFQGHSAGSWMPATSTLASQGQARAWRFRKDPPCGKSIDPNRKQTRGFRNGGSRDNRRGKFFQTCRRILFSISIPATVVMAIWEFTSIWNAFLYVVVLANGAGVQPIMVAPNNLAGSYNVEWNVQMVGALLAAMPTLLLYILLGRYFIRSLLAGELKG